MKIPHAIKIGGLKYRVRIVKEIDKKDESAGETDSQKLIISLLSGQKQQALEVSFLHDMFHAINLNLDEKEVEYLAMALYQVIRDNPGLFKYGK